MHRAIAALLLSVMAAAISAPVTCTGWEPTPSERLACCQRAAHDCADQVAADTCCAQQEQAHQPGSTASAPATAVPIVLDAVWAPAACPDAIAPIATPGLELVLHTQQHAPPGAFALPLRI